MLDQQAMAVYFIDFTQRKGIVPIPFPGNET
jgi:hypothetical protein